MNLSLYFKEFRYNFKLAYPIIISMIGHMIVGIIDNIMVGKIGTVELAAASFANSFVFLAISLGIGFSTAITPLVAISDAEKNDSNGKKILTTGTVLCIVLSLFLFGLLIGIKPLFELMNQPQEVLVLAKPYLNIVSLSLIPLIIFQSFKQFTDGKSLTKYSMYATILTNILNIFFNYVSIYGIWIFPQMGMIGTAYGTLISRCAMLVFIIIVLRNNKQLKYFMSGISLKNFCFNKAKKIINVGIPSAMQSFFEVALFTGAVWLSGMIGTNYQAANQIALTLASFTFMFANGLSVAAMIRVGNQIGLKNYSKLKVVVTSIILMTIILYTFFALLFLIFKEELPLLFLNINDPRSQNVLEISSYLLLIAAVFQISDGLQVTILGALRGLHDAKVPMIITFISYWVVGYPVCIYLGLYTPLKAEGIWYGLLAGLTVSAGLLYFRLKYKIKQLN